MVNPTQAGIADTVGRTKGGVKPILFSEPMVRALVAGTKTQTRRIFKGIEQVGDGVFHISTSGGGVYGLSEESVPKWAPDYLRIATDDRLYVRETFSGLWEFEGIPPREWPHPYPLWYWAAGNPPDGDWTKPRPGIHMPRWASRITLTVTDVRVERLQDISEADALAEGIERIGPVAWKNYSLDSSSLLLPVNSYRTLWDAINGPDSWHANPWVAAYTFTLAMGNVDQIGGAS